MKKSSWEFGLSTHRGTIKQTNEDNAFLRMTKDNKGEEITVVIIADGMGGYKAGEVASQTIISKMETWWEQRIYTLLKEIDPIQAIQKEMDQLLRETNENLIHYGNITGKRLGTTASVLFLYKKRFLICHVGDSRIYHLENVNNRKHTNKDLSVEDVTAALEGEFSLIQLTEDHSWVNEQVRKGQLTEEEANQHPNKNVLLQCLGIANDITPYYETGTYVTNDSFLLCTDGFYNMYPDKKILSFLHEWKHSKEDVQKLTDYLVSDANSLGATDNITVLIIQGVSTTTRSWGEKFIQLFKNEGKAKPNK